MSNFCTYRDGCAKTTETTYIISVGMVVQRQDRTHEDYAHPYLFLYAIVPYHPVPEEGYHM